MSEFKRMYLFVVICFGLIFLAVGSTYAIFTADAKIDNPVSFVSSLTYDDESVEIINVSLSGGEMRRYTLNITNTNNSSVNYVIWHNTSNDNIEISSVDGNSTGVLSSNVSTTVEVDVRNNGTSSVNMMLGIVFDEDSIVLDENMQAISDESLIPVIASGSTWYISSVDKTTITKISFVDNYTTTGNETESWNVGVDLNKDGENESNIICYLNGTELTIAGNGTGKIYANRDSSSMFQGFSGVTSIEGISLLDTSNVVDMGAMFYRCSGLTSLDLSSFDTSKVMNMKEMFYECTGLTSLNVSEFDTSNVNNMAGMFNFCSALTSLSLSNFDTGKVTDINSMFRGCSKLTSLDLSSFDTSNVTTMSGMFVFDSALTELILTSFDTSRVKDMSYMFHSCSGLTTLDLSSFDVSNVRNMNYMFRYDSALKTIYVSNLWNVKYVVTSAVMFDGCSSLVGGSRTAYNTSYLDKTYARIDGGTSSPGYLTYKAAP